MDEATWLAATTPQPMLEHLRGQASDRKFRLFAVACCRRIAHLVTDQRILRTVAAAELYADGLITEEELVAARLGAWSSLDSAAWAAEAAASSSVLESEAAATWVAGMEARSPGLVWTMKRQARVAVQAAAAARSSASLSAQAELVRELIGNPWRPLVIDPAWRTTDALTLAAAAYRESALPSGALDNTRLAILADALEEAGATGALLEHLRAPGHHVRGCHALDAVLGLK